MSAKSLAKPMTFSVYPRERDALLRITRERRLKSPFDVVRMLAKENLNKSVRPEDFSEPKVKS